MRPLLLALVACAPHDTSPTSPCEADPPPPGELRVTFVACPEHLLPKGEGQSSDIAVSNAWFRAVFRHPQDALTLAGVGGGTLIDAAPWGLDDALHEIAPLVGGGGLAVDDWSVEADGLRLEGTVVSLPDRPADTPGAAREVRWTLDPHGPWIRLEGADGLWLHPSGDAQILDGQVLVGDVVIGHDGRVAHDLGGALRIDDATRLLVAPAEKAWGLLAADTVPLSGQADGATELRLYRDEEEVGRLPVRGGRFDTRVPAGVTAVRAWAPGRSPSAALPPSAGLELTLGPPARLLLRPVGIARPFGVDWTSDDGRSGRVALPAEGGELPLGAGTYTLRVSAGPAWQEIVRRVELGAEDALDWELALEPAFDTASWVQVAIGAPSDVDRHFRGSNATAVRSLAAAGFDHAVFAPADEVATVTAEDAEGWLTGRNGARLTHRGGAWSVLAWSWFSNPGNNAHGVHDIAGLAPEDALAVAYGGPSRDRFTVVDAAFLSVVGAPWQVDPRPDFVHLQHPERDPEGWDRWFAWLDARAPLGPLGPVTWAPVDDPTSRSAVDVERGLVRGRASAGTGPLLTLEVDGAPPGEIVALSDAPLSVRAELRGGPLDQLAIVGTHGRVIVQEPGSSWQGELAVEPGWLIALAWDEAGEAWAVTSPVWLDSP